MTSRFPVDAETVMPSSDDAAALDALVAAAFDLPAALRQPGGASPERIRRLAELLGLLDGRPGDPALADAAIARVMQYRRHAEPTLTSADDAALEALVMAGFESSGVPQALRPRARRLQALLQPLAEVSLDGPGDDLVGRVLARIAEAPQETMPSPAPWRWMPRHIRLADVVSVAAVALIGVSLVLPVAGAAREQARRAACHANVGQTAQAMASYAADFRSSLPLAAPVQGMWWRVGEPGSSNSANLFMLVRAGYVSPGRLACPGNPAAPTRLPPDACDWRSLDEVSYSYQIQSGPRPTWYSTRVVVLADRSPIVSQAVRGEEADPFANAPNHRGAGQHVLWTDGSASWQRSPLLTHGDNIWLPRYMEAIANQLAIHPRRVPPLRGTETPAASDDAFLGP